MMPPILECGIFKVCYGPVGANNMLLVECCECSKRPQYKVTLAQTGNLYRHVKTHYPDLKYKIESKKIEQQCTRNKQRNEKKKQAKTQKNREKKKKEMAEFKFVVGILNTCHYFQFQHAADRALKLNLQKKALKKELKSDEAKEFFWPVWLPKKA